MHSTLSVVDFTFLSSSHKPLNRKYWQCPLQILFFSDRSVNKDGRSGLWLAETFEIYIPSTTFENNLTKLDWKTKIAALASDWQIFSTSLWPLNGVKRNLTGSNYTRLCFGADRKQSWLPMTSYWLRHFWLLRCTKFDEIWQEASTQRPLPSWSFSCWSENKDDRLGLRSAHTSATAARNFVETFMTRGKNSTSSAKFLLIRSVGKQKLAVHGLFLAEAFFTFLLYRIRRNVTGGKYSTSSKSVCFRANP